MNQINCIQKNLKAKQREIRQKVLQSREQQRIVDLQLEKADLQFKQKQQEQLASLRKKMNSQELKYHVLKKTQEQFLQFKSYELNMKLDLIKKLKDKQEKESQKKKEKLEQKEWQKTMIIEFEKKKKLRQIKKQIQLDEKRNEMAKKRLQQQQENLLKQKEEIIRQQQEKDQNILEKQMIKQDEMKQQQLEKYFALQDVKENILRTERIKESQRDDQQRHFMEKQEKLQKQEELKNELKNLRIQQILKFQKEQELLKQTFSKKIAQMNKGCSLNISVLNASLQSIDPNISILPINNQEFIQQDDDDYCPYIQDEQFFILEKNEISFIDKEIFQHQICWNKQLKIQYNFLPHLVNILNTDFLKDIDQTNHVFQETLKMQQFKSKLKTNYNYLNLYS